MRGDVVKSSTLARTRFKTAIIIEEYPAQGLVKVNMNGSVVTIPKVWTNGVVQTAAPSTLQTDNTTGQVTGVPDIPPT